jgi:hypothetical protein
MTCTASLSLHRRTPCDALSTGTARRTPCDALSTGTALTQRACLSRVIHEYSARLRPDHTLTIRARKRRPRGSRDCVDSSNRNLKVLGSEARVGNGDCGSWDLNHHDDDALARLYSLQQRTAFSNGQPLLLRLVRSDWRAVSTTC